MREFDLLIPSSLDAALDALDANASAQPLAGGTDMIVDVRAGRRKPDTLVALRDVSELRGVTRTNGTLRVGGGTTISQLMQVPALAAHPVLSQAAFWFANPMIRNVATLGGNIASASPAGDMLPPLLALDAQIELLSVVGTRMLSLADFFLGPRKTARAPGELILALQFPAHQQSTGEAFYKLGLRQADAISIVSVAVWIARDGNQVSDVRVALGAVAPRPLRAREAESALRGNAFREETVRDAARRASLECAPIDDLRGTAKYRRRMVEVYVRRMLEQAWARTM